MYTFYGAVCIVAGNDAIAVPDYAATSDLSVCNKWEIYVLKKKERKKIMGVQFY